MSFVNFIKTSLYGTPPGHCFWSMNKIIWIKKPCRKFPEQWNQRLRSRRSLRPATLLKKGLWHRCFPVNFVKFLRTPFFTDYLWMTAFTNLNTIYHIHRFSNHLKFFNINSLTMTFNSLTEVPSYRNQTITQGDSTWSFRLAFLIELSFRLLDLTIRSSRLQVVYKICAFYKHHLLPFQPRCCFTFSQS